MADFKKQISRVYGIGVYQLVLACVVALLAVLTMIGYSSIILSGGGGSNYSGALSIISFSVMIIIVLVISPIFIVSMVLKIISFVKSLKAKKNLNNAPDLALKQMYTSSLLALISGIYDVCLMFAFSLILAIISSTSSDAIWGAVLALFAFMITLGMAVPNLIIFIGTVKTKKLIKG